MTIESKTYPEFKPCILCTGSGKRIDKHTHLLRVCVACNGLGVYKVKK
jgi:DnaJ-class molecular chaperone